MAKTAMIRYSSEDNSFNQVVINSDDSFVIIGDKEVTETELEKMIDWEDVYGWVKTDV